MVSLLTIITVLLFMFTSLGFSFSKLFSIHANLTEKILLGLVISNSLASYISIFVPLTYKVLLCFIILGVLCLNYSRYTLFKAIFIIRRNIYLLVTLTPIIIISLIKSTTYPHNYDTGLYHLQAIMWIEEFRAIPGLANLYGRLGFNPNIFSLFALSSLKGLFHQELFGINVTIFIVVTIYILKRIICCFKNKTIDNFFLFLAFSLIFVLRLENLSSPSPDFLAQILPIFIFLRLYEISICKIHLNPKVLLPILLLSVYCITIKLSSIPLLLLLLFALSKNYPRNKKIVFEITLFGFFRLLPWLVRNVILTGWLIYPFPNIDLFSFDWKVPLSKVIFEKNGVTGYARIPCMDRMISANLKFNKWYPVWWRSKGFIEKVFIMCSFMFPLITSILILSKLILINYWQKCILIISFFGIIFWFMLAPDSRFGMSFIFMCTIFPIVICMQRFKFSLKISSNRITFLFIFLVTSYFFRCNLWLIEAFIRRDPSLFSNGLLIPTKSEAPKNFKFGIYSREGINIYYPTTNELSYNHPIPCTPYPDSCLQLRGKNLLSGFKTENK